MLSTHFNKKSDSRALGKSSSELSTNAEITKGIKNEKSLSQFTEEQYKRQILMKSNQDCLEPID